ncbi:MAG TPA: lytic transglycosylase domain-containing protein [Hyphomonadaceae bacterium]|nr:lytic transglycosylase domain-containing protein [Hyphomonadaceae bacterium]
MDGKALHHLRAALARAGLLLAFAAPASAQVIQIGPEGVTSISGPVVVTPEGAIPIVAERKAPVSSKHAAAAPLLESAGQATDISPRLLEAIAYVESRFNTKAVSPKGAVGMMQLMPGTAEELGVDPHDPQENARGGADYLRRMVTLFGNNVELAVAAYNAGPAAVLKYGGVPPYAETRAYVDAVMEYLAKSSVPETD